MTSILFKSKLDFNGSNSNPIISKTQKIFLNLFEHFWNVNQILNILKETISLIADVFPKL